MKYEIVVQLDGSNAFLMNKKIIFFEEQENNFVNFVKIGKSFFNFSDHWIFFGCKSTPLGSLRRSK